MVLSWLAALALASTARAQPIVRAPAAPAPIVGGMVSAVSVSLSRQPFYASMLVNAFDFHLRQVASMSGPQAAAYLRAEILAGNKAPADARGFADSLRGSPIDERRAAAILLANAAARPEQFRETLNGLETARQGLGKALQSRLAAGGDASGRLADHLRALGARFDARPEGGIYDSRGKLQALFDNAAPVGYPPY